MIIKKVLIGNQIELAKKYIKAHYPDEKYNVKIIIFEEQQSSMNSIKNLSFQRILFLIKKNKINILISYQLDRINRNLNVFNEFLDLLNSYHVNLVLINRTKKHLKDFEYLIASLKIK